METYDQNTKGKRSTIMRTLLIVVAALFLLSLLFMIIFMVRNSRINEEKDLIEADRLTLLEDYEQLQSEKSARNLQIAGLETQLQELEMKREEQLQTKDVQITVLRRQSRDAAELREQIQAYQIREDDFNKMKVLYNQLLEEYENLDLKHNNTTTQYTILRDSVEQSRDLQVYHIQPLTKWERWLWADRYHIDRARRVDQTQIGFELAGSLFAPHGSRTIYLSMFRPDGTVMYPDQETLTVNGGDNPVPYTTKQEVQFSGSPVPITFTVDHPERLSPGEYTIKVYIGSDLIRTERLQLQ